jgi:hypothetical protein
LPFLPDFTDIEIFKDELCQSLERGGSKIQLLRAEMEELAESAQATVQVLIETSFDLLTIFTLFLQPLFLFV